MSIIDDLIFDRTSDNLKKGDPKGKYDYIDFNRVNEVVNLVSSKIGAGINAKTDWTNTDIPRESDATEYRTNIQKIVDTLELNNKVPQTNNSILTILGANQIEKALYDAYNITEKIMVWDEVDALNETWEQLSNKNIQWKKYFLREENINGYYSF